jgi:hypothetical protein
MAKTVYHIGFKSWLRARHMIWLYPYYQTSEHAKLVAPKSKEPEVVDF